MKKQLAIWFLFLLAAPVFAQAPLGFNYQGIARQADGTPIANQTIGIRVSITEGAQGPSQFSEEHFPITNEFGLFTLIVGKGNGNSTLNSVNWSGGNLWLQIEMDPEDNGNYILMGSQQLMSVPYALYAQQSGGGLRAGYGLDITNSTISNLLPDIPITLTGTGNVAISGTYPNFTIDGVAQADGDADATNELQDLQLTGNNLSITNSSAAGIDLAPFLDNTDNQNLINVLGLGNDAGNTQIKNLADPTDLQDAATKNYVDIQNASLNTLITANTSDIANNSSSITAEATNRASGDAAIQSELDATQSGSGLETNGNYTSNVSTNYLSGASSLKNADELLDAQVANNAGNISTLTSRLDNTYSFQADFSYQESGAVTDNQIGLVENMDSFNQIASNEITIGATGLYLILVDADRAGYETNSIKLTIRVNTTNYNIYAFTNDQNIGRTLMVNLVAGDKITLLSTTVSAMSFQVNGVIGGYKISN